MAHTQQWQVHTSLGTRAKAATFHDAIQIWLNKPHVVNRRLCGADISYNASGVGLKDSLEEFAIEISNNDFHCENHLQLKPNLEAMIAGSSGNVSIYIRDYLPKDLNHFPRVREVVLQDLEENLVLFIPIYRLDKSGELISGCVGDLAFGFKFRSEKSQIDLLLLNGSKNPCSGDLKSSEEMHNATLHTKEWLTNILLKKLARWSEESSLTTEATSLKLVSVQRYNEEYQRLKTKYGPHLISIWPECTDPQKFVYEDIAIATYLMVFWAADKLCGGKPQSFVDLGCGNGLLVHILNSEGHKGLGLDLRKRKIWDIYDPKANLKECTITPSDETLFPEYDWLIGNHSDELTPWIPVMASRSSFSCRYFVIPCCLWDFTQKFSARNSQKNGPSQYRSYLNFVEEVGEKCGFVVKEDTLRIPSTKKVCFIGESRTYRPEDEASMNVRRKNYIDQRISLCTSSKEKQENKETAAKKRKIDDGERSWAEEFKARDKEEKVCNCVSVDAQTKDKIIHRVFEALLKEGDSDAPWNAGGSIALGNIAAMFDSETLKELKSECGGLQTLLRNSHHVFKVQAGHVTLRDWASDDYKEYQAKKHRRKGQPNRDVTQLKKTRRCFFFAFHPQGCPLSSSDCRFAHGNDELVKISSDKPTN